MKKETFIQGFLLGVLLLLSYNPGKSQGVKLDLNFDGRKEDEVHEPGYLSWIIGSGQSTSFTTSDVTFNIVSESGYASAWYKAGVQNPYYARLVNDGIISNDMELQISGLSAGKHSLVTYHNAFTNPENNTVAPMDIFVNGDLIYENIVLSVRATSTETATSAFVEFDVAEGETVTIRFRGETSGGYSITGAHLNGFELDVADPSKQSRSPYPADRDEHANADDGQIELKWTAASGITSHNVYFGTSEAAVQTANPDSPEFLGNQSDTSIQVNVPNLIKYYWRVDELTATDTTKGAVWYFIPRRVAFPGAEGYGGYAIGGRGGKVVYVTNLDDSGPGSFRYAVENETGPRTILFAVSGLITLHSRLVIRDDYITVAGQSSPGKGVCFRWAPIGVTGDNLIVQHLRMRLGIGITFDGMGLTGAESSIVDHCSISWTIDEAFSSRGAKNITLQRTLISEALNKADHDKQNGSAHGYAASIGGDVGSFHHNLLAHCAGRNWSMAGGLDGNAYYAGRLDMTNNVVYNWDNRTTDGGAHEVNFVNNYYKPGPATDHTYAITADHEETGLGTQRYYVAGNVMPGYFDADDVERSRRITGNADWETWVDEPFFPSLVTTQTAEEAYKLVLSDVGATQPVFDDHDIRVVNETLEGTTSFRGSRTGLPGLPDHEEDAGSWERYPGFTRSDDWDSDLDGLPDWWEGVIGTDPNSDANDFTDPNADHDNDLFTNLEEYLEWMSHPHYFISGSDSIEIDLGNYTRGFTNGPSFTIERVFNGEVKLKPGTSVAKFKATGSGLAEFEFVVTDLDNTSMTRKISFYVGDVPEDSLFDYSYYKDRNQTEIVHVGETVEEPTDTTDTTLGNFDQKLNLWPNPASSHLNIRLQAQQTPATEMYIVDMSGKRMRIENFNYDSISNSLTIDISSLQPGTYVIHSVNGANKQSYRFVKR